MVKKSINSIMIGVIALVVIVSIGALVIYVSNSSRQMAMGLEQEALFNVADCVVRSFEDFIQNGIATAKNMAGRRSIVHVLENGNREETAQIFSDYVKQNKGIVAVAVVFDTSSQIVAGSTINGDLLTKGDLRGKNYVKAILSGKDFFVSPTLNKSITTGKFIWVTAVPVKDKEGNLIGGVALGTDIKMLFHRHVSSLRFGKGGYAFVLDDQGKLLTHPNKKNIMRDVSHHDFVSYALKHETGSLDYTFEGQEKFLCFKQVPYVHWIVGLTARHAEMETGAVEQGKVLIGVGIGVILALIVVISFISRRLIFEPLSRIGAFVDKVSHGDYQATLEGTFKYELIAVADDIKTMVAEIKNKMGFFEGVLQGIVLPCSLVGPDNKLLWANEHLLTLVGLSEQPEDIVGWDSGTLFFGDKHKQCLSEVALKEQRQVSGENNEYSNRAGEKKAVHMTTTPFYDLDGNILGTISFWLDLTEIREQQHRIEDQNEKIAAIAKEAFAVADQMAGASEELSAQIEQSRRGADIQRERVQETATAMEEMNATVLEVARNASGAAEGADTAKTRAENGQNVVDRVIQAITQVQEQSQAMKVNMEALGQQAEDIGNVMNVISDIADQTNLLALNAAIEAARAGEAGRGFAVVADEVRKLAEKTMVATKEVGTAISSIQQGTRGAAEDMDKAVFAVEAATDLAGESGEALREIVSLVDTASDQVRSIATASEEQSATSEEINQSVEEINRISTETAGAMEESERAVSDLAKLAQELNQLIRDLQDA